MEKLTLQFFGSELTQTAFEHPLLPASALTVRGKASGAFKGSGCFQWTQAVQALSILLLRSFIASFKPESDPTISGLEGSPAASLDYALDKQPLWIADMFGLDSRGRSLAKRMLLRTNPNRKRPGPVVLRLNERFLPAESLCIYRDGGKITVAEAEVLVAAIERGWTTAVGRTQTAKAAA